MVVGEEEEILHWGAKKSKEGWEEFIPLMVADGAGRLNDGKERSALLCDQIKHSSSVDHCPDDLKAILGELPEAFSVAGTDATQTDVVEMNIDTGDLKPAKIRTQPVP